MFDGRPDVAYSLIDIDCGQDNNDFVHLPSSHEPSKINCSVIIQDDKIAHESDELYILRISLISPNSSSVSPGRTVLSLSILDDDG